MSIALMSAAALLLTINLAVIVTVMDPAILESLRAQILASAVLLGLSILLGTIAISILIRHVEALTREQPIIGAERTARWLSAFQFWLFFFGMGAMIWAIVLRLY